MKNCPYCGSLDTYDCVNSWGGRLRGCNACNRAYDPARLAIEAEAERLAYNTHRE